MASKGINLAEECKVVPLLHPVSGTATSDIINMKNYQHASIILVQGVAATATTVTVKGSDDNASTTTSAISFQYYSEATSGIDLLGARTSAGTAGFSMTSGSNQYAVIEVDGSELPSGQSFLLVDMTSADSLISAVAILSGGRFKHDQSETLQS
jgi:hypothetical protein